MEKIRKNKKVISVFLIPAVLIYLCFELIPVVMSVYFSFNDWPWLQAVPLKFVGFKNYSNLFHNAVFLKSLQNVLIYVVVSVILQVPIGFGLGLLIHHFKKGQRFFKAARLHPRGDKLPARPLRRAQGEEEGGHTAPSLRGKERRADI